MYSLLTTPLLLPLAAAFIAARISVRERENTETRRDERREKNNARVAKGMLDRLPSDEN